MLATVDNNGPAFLWSVPAGKLLATLSYSQFAEGLSLAFSPDGKTLAVSDDSGIRLWNIATRKITETLTDGPQRSLGVAAVAFSPDGKTLVTADRNGYAYLWHTSTYTRFATLHQQGFKTINGVAFSPDGKYVAEANDDGRSYVWLASSGRIGDVIRDPQSGPDPDGVTFSPDSRTLAVADPGTHQTILWNLKRQFPY
jgi:WD40 repeat protein